MDAADGWSDGRGTRMRYSSTVGDPSRAGAGRPLLLLNGLGAPLETWQPLRDQLVGRTTVAFDAPGTGASPLARWPLGIAGLADLSCALLDGLGIEQVDVLGFSFGGAVAQELAHRHRGRVGALVLASTSCGWGGTVGDPVALGALAWSLPFAGVAPGGSSPQRIGDPASPSEWSRAEAAWASRPPTPLGVWWQMTALGAWSSWPWLPSLDAPTLAIAGAADRVVPPANAESLATRMPRAELALVPDAGHFRILADDPAAVTTPIAEFLGRQDAAVVST